MKFATGPQDILIFDVEVRPTAWIGGDFVGRSMTCASYSWLDEDYVSTNIITRESTSNFDVVIPLASAIEAADLAVGHFIRGFDFTVLSGDLERNGLAPLEKVNTIDTKMDRLATSGLSESLENLIARYKLDTEKLRMSEPDWEAFNLYQPPALVEKVRARCESDVKATKELFVALRDAGRLKDTKVWTPEMKKVPRYRA